MDRNLLGRLRLRIKRGINLAIRDVTKTNDPYIVVTLGRYKMKTRTIKKNINPEWNEELTLPIANVNDRIRFAVFDKDHITGDDPMGDAEVDLKPYIQCLKMAEDLDKLPEGCALKKIQPGRDNCLSKESHCNWHEGKIVQEMVLKLRNVECGEIVIQIGWIHVPGSKGLAAIQV